MQRNYTKKVVVLDERSSPDARAERLRRIRNLANLSREQMCEDGLINMNTYKGWEIARYGGLPVDGAERVISRVAREGVLCTSDWLLHEVGTGPLIQPDYYRVREEPASYQVLKNCEQAIIHELLVFRSQFPGSLDFKIEDNGLSPYYYIGDYVAGIKRFGEDIASLVGENCIVQTANGRTYARNLRAGGKPGKYTLQCLNPQTSVQNPIMYDEELVCAAQIIRHYRNC